MQGTSSIDQRILQYHARFALVEALTGIIAAAWRILSNGLETIAQNRRQAQARRELHRLDDHFLQDIGLDRRQIDQLFR